MRCQNSSSLVKLQISRLVTAWSHINVPGNPSHHRKGYVANASRDASARENCLQLTLACIPWSICHLTSHDGTDFTVLNLAQRHLFDKLICHLATPKHPAKEKRRSQFALRAPLAAHAPAFYFPGNFQTREETDRVAAPLFKLPEFHPGSRYLLDLSQCHAP